MTEAGLVRNATTGIRPETAGWTYLSFRTVRRAAGEEITGETGPEETAFIWLGGTAEVERFGPVGDRSDVFSGLPSALLLPPGASYRMRATTALHLAITSAPADAAVSPQLIRPRDIRIESRGRGVTERRIHWILSEKDEASRLLLVEVLTPAGHWSTYPPHKHDEDVVGRERALEELYYYRFKPEQGFAFQAIYSKKGQGGGSHSPSPSGGGQGGGSESSPSPSGGGQGGGSRSPSPSGGGQGGGDLNVAIRARNDDLVLVPRGYHVVSAAPGYDCYYLNAMAGAVREWLFTTDPEHEWLMDWQKQ